MTLQPEPHHEPLGGQPRRESREELLTWAEPFPAYPELVIDGLSDDEEAAFLAAIDRG